MSAELRLPSVESVVSRFVAELVKDPALDQEVVAAIQNLHSRNQLNTTSILSELRTLRERWEYESAVTAQDSSTTD